MASGTTIGRGGLTPWLLVACLAVAGCSEDDGGVAGPRLEAGSTLAAYKQGVPCSDDVEVIHDDASS